MSFSSELFKEKNIIAKNLDGFEARQEQIDMARAVEAAIENSHHLVVEAGTGVGKSLAYLVPLINWAVSNKRRVVISTYTKALQNQIYIKDLPFLKRILDVDFEYALCLGSDNYACLRKAQRVSEWDEDLTKKGKKEVKKVASWLNGTDTGLSLDMDFVPGKDIWSKFSRDPDLCLGWKCPQKKECFYMQAKRRQNESHILVANHSLTFTDIISGSHILPEYHALVLDEAHTVEDVATKHFGKEAGTFSLRYLISGIVSIFKNETPDILKVQFSQEIDRVREILESIRDISIIFFEQAEKNFDRKNYEIQLGDEVSYESISSNLRSLSSMLAKIAEEIKDVDPKNRKNDLFLESLIGYVEKFKKYAINIDFIFGNRSDNYVYWASSREWKKGKEYSFSAAPVDVSDEMRIFIFDKVCPVILTSATLSSGGNFNFIKKRLGLNTCEELLLDSPFDYERNVLVYLSKEIADPNANVKNYTQDVKKQIMKIMK